jgi:hypothetical protein
MCEKKYSRDVMTKFRIYELEDEPGYGEEEDQTRSKGVGVSRPLLDTFHHPTFKYDNEYTCAVDQNPHPQFHQVKIFDQSNPLAFLSWLL